MTAQAKPTSDAGGAQAVLFDAAGTLVDLQPSLAARVLATLRKGGYAVEERDIARAFVEIERLGLWPDETLDTGTRVRRWRAFLHNLLGRAAQGWVPSTAVNALCDEVLSPAAYAAYPEVRSTLAELRKRGYRLGIVSNFDPWLRAILAETGIAEIVSSVTVSAEVGSRKPDPVIFRAALADLSISAEATVFVGDSPWSDVCGARAVGMRPILVDRAGTALASRGTIVVRSLSELLAMSELR